MKSNLNYSNHWTKWTHTEIARVKSAVKLGLNAVDIQRTYFSGGRTLTAVRRKIIALKLRKKPSYDIVDIWEAFLKVGLELQSRKYKGQSKCYKYRCLECGWTQKKSASNVFHKPEVSGCPRCVGRIILLGDARQLARSMKGQCLTRGNNQRVISATKKMLWLCQARHRPFLKNYNKIKSSHQWCPDCSDFLSERIVRVILEHLTGSKFPRERNLPWLKSEKGNWLELDGYNPKLKAAFEHWGQFHYMRNSFYNKGKRFIEVQNRDLLKMFLCEANRIKLIHIPELFADLPINQVQTYIFDQLKSNRIAMVSSRTKIQANISSAYASNVVDLQKEIKGIVSDHGGIVLGRLPKRAKDSFKVFCGVRGHKPFTPSLYRLRNSSWCRICSSIASAEERKATIESINYILASQKKHYLCTSPESLVSGHPRTILEFTCQLTGKPFGGHYSYYVNKAHARCQVCK